MKTGVAIFFVALFAICLWGAPGCAQKSAPTITDSKTGDIDASTNAIRAELRAELKAEFAAFKNDIKQTTSAPSEQNGIFNLNWTSVSAVGGGVVGLSILAYAMLLISRWIESRAQIANKKIDDGQEARLGASTDKQIELMTGVQLRLIEALLKTQQLP